MMRKLMAVALAVAGCTLLAGSVSAATIVSSFDASYTADGQWYTNDVRTGGTASIVDPTGVGAPVGDGAALLTTNLTNAAKAQVGVVDAYGLAGDFINDTLLISYSYYKQTVAGGNLAAAPSLKLTFKNFGSTTDPDTYMTLIYEPTWNGGNPTPDQWNGVTITSTSGLFWSNGGLGATNSYGGPPLKTLSDWATFLGTDFTEANLVEISMGVGTYNQGQIGYFDDVQIASSNYSAAYDFEEANAVPEPATLTVWSILGLVGIGFTRRRRVA